MYKLSIFIPKTHLEEVKQALFAAGAGKIGDYDSCCWETIGKGQFRPLEGSLPYLGNKGTLEKLEEFKVEMVCEERNIKAVLQALKNSHPYEEPAYDVIKLEDF